MTTQVLINLTKLGFNSGMWKRPGEPSVVAGCIRSLKEEIAHAKRRFGLRSSTEIVSCYKVGWGGFWIRRFLESIGVRNHVVDSSSIEVDAAAEFVSPTNSTWIRGSAC